ncbi:putative methyltransferase-like protein 15 [Dinothrombium tinctorium]|uniref:Putative methyltransferase-like protein 15 n=1 Tax=Dinothrombium tinctorium TaxID=1965070 RepID=A0A3S3Q8S9_9ACAR|nr:putative methyltransferase-like protein 15 [Dinothrombium tinctorium]RWS15954.1 putative methyltransferase-like protein 15 [Dinothrombium tinctorium]
MNSLVVKATNQPYLTHIPILAKEITSIFAPKDGQKFIDMTFGSGGHSKYLLSRNKNITIYALDRDPIAYRKAVDLSTKMNGCIVPLLGKFSDLPMLLQNVGVKKGSINGVILDLGPSSMQYDDPSRGFSISSEGPLDMRMDGNRNPNIPTADDVINTLDSNSLAKIFKIYGEEKLAKKFANAIVDSRFMLKRIKTTQELSQLLASVAGQHSVDSIGRFSHAATKVFLALRIFVNNELNELNYALTKIREYLVLDDSVNFKNSDNEDELKKYNSGKIAVISFHSLEDRIVKRHLKGINIDEPIAQTISQKVNNSFNTPTQEEIETMLEKKWKKRCFQIQEADLQN